MRALLLVLPLLTGCLEISQTVYRFDLKARTGTMESRDIRTDSPENAQADFAQLVNEMVLGDAALDEHPTWLVTDRRLEERDGVVVGVMDFRFAEASDVGLYQFDKKSAYIWCAKEGERIAATNGVVIPQYPHCVAFSRKEKVFEIAVDQASGTPGSRSLVEELRGWDGERIEGVAAGGLLGALGGLGDAMGQLMGAGGEGGAFDLGALLPAVQMAPEWQALALPTDGGSIVTSTPEMLVVSHPAADHGGDHDGLRQRYADALRRSGFTVKDTAAGEASFTKEDATITLAITPAGPSSLVVLQRR